MRGLAARRACPPPFFFELSTLLPLHIHSAASLGACLAAAQHGSLAQPLDRLCEAMQQQWGAMEALYSEGKAKAIGVSNYCPACLDCLAETSKVTPMVNQILMHVGMRALGNASALPAECTRRGIVAQAYSPLGSGSSKVLDAALTKKIGAAHDVSSAQVALRWLVQSGYPAITAASSKQAAYMREDVAIFNWTLTSSEMAELKVATFADESPVKMMCY